MGLAGYQENVLAVLARWLLHRTEKTECLSVHLVTVMVFSREVPHPSLGDGSCSGPTVEVDRKLCKGS